jgi:hypothetical protein
MTHVTNVELLYTTLPQDSSTTEQSQVLPAQAERVFVLPLVDPEQREVAIAFP